MKDDQNSEYRGGLFGYQHRHNKSQFGAVMEVNEALKVNDLGYE